MSEPQSPPDTPSGKITVKRTSPNDVQNRQIYVTLDGAPLATLLFGRAATRPLAPGPHTLVADNTWKKRRLEFTAAPGDHLHFQVVSSPGKGYNFLVGLFGAAPIEISIEPLPAETGA